MRRLARPHLRFHERHVGELDIDDHLALAWPGFFHLGWLEHPWRPELPHDH